MSKHVDSFTIDKPIKECLYASKKVIADINWRVLEQTKAFYIIKEVAPQATSSTWPAKIQIELNEISNEETEVTLYGSIFGFGPIQSNHLRGQMGNFRNRLELETLNI